MIQLIRLQRDNMGDEYKSSITDPLNTFSQKEFGEWQLCPKCNGSGKAANFNNQIPSYLDICDVCNGAKIISRPIINQTK